MICCFRRFATIFRYILKIFWLFRCVWTRTWSCVLCPWRIWWWGEPSSGTASPHIFSARFSRSFPRSVIRRSSFRLGGFELKIIWTSCSVFFEIYQRSYKKHFWKELVVRISVKKVLIFAKFLAPETGSVLANVDPDPGEPNKCGSVFYLLE